MKILLGLSGFLLIGLALVPGAYVLTALQASEAADTLGNGVLLFRIMLVITGIYFFFLSRLDRPLAPEDPARLYDEAPLWSYAALFGIFVLATVLRGYALERGIWFDEMLMHVRYMDEHFLRVLTIFDDSNNHLLYTSLAKFSIDTFGDTVTAIRLPAVVFGLAGILALYAYARRVVSWPEALIATLLITVSYHHIWFSQNARGYTALLFFSMASSMFLIDAIRSRSRSLWLAYAVTAALGAFTHLTIGFLFLGQFAYFAWRALVDRSEEDTAAQRFMLGMLFGFVPLGLLTLLLYAIVLPDILGGALLSSGLQRESEWSNPIWAIQEFITSLSIGFSGLGVIAAGGFVTLVGILSFLRRDCATPVLLIVPVGLAVLLMTSIGYTLFPRFFFFAMGFGILIAIRGATVIGTFASWLLGLSGPARTWVTLAPGLVLVLGSLLSLPNVYFPKQNFEASIAYIEAEADTNDAIAVLGIAEMPYIRYYGKDWVAVETAQDVNALLESGQRVWLIYNLPVQARTGHPDVMALLEAEFDTAETFWGSLNGGEIVVSVSQANSE